MKSMRRENYPSSPFTVKLFTSLYLLLSLRVLLSSATVEEVLDRVSQITGLAVKHPVELLVLDEKAIRGELDKMIELNLPENYIEASQRVLVKLGLIEEGIDLREKLISAYAKMAIGFYSPITKKMVLRKNLNPALSEFILSHELTHALQDQHFDLKSKLSDRSNSDRLLALVSIIEGQAMLVSNAYLARFMKPKDRRTILLDGMNRLVQQDLGGIPPFIVRTLHFPYTTGFIFTNRLFAKAGFPSLNKAFTDPPLSSEQVLHPEKYGGAVDKPIELSIREPEKLLSEPFRYLLSDVMGEFSTGLLLEKYLPYQKWKPASEGWDGDRWFAYSSASGVLFVWASTWDTEADAEEFLSAMQELLKVRYKVQPPSPSATTDALSVYLEKHSKDVLFIDGPRSVDTTTLAQKFWEQLKKSGSN